VDYRLKTNAVMLLDMGHTFNNKGRTHMGEIGKGKET
jgi:hypothetical protein